MRGTLFAAIAALLYLAGSPSMGAQGQSPVTIDESRIRASLQNESTALVFPISNALDHKVQAQLSLEWIDKDDRSLSSVVRDISIPRGATSVEVPFPIPKPTLWLRLRYSLTPTRQEARLFAPQTSVLALPEIAAHVFELKVTHAGTPRPGQPFTIYAQAMHPVTRAPVDGLKWSARITFGGVAIAPAVISREAEGLVAFVFNIPSSDGNQDGDDSKIWVQGRRGDFVSDVVADLSVADHLSARLQTDKPIYQPGQTLHLRAVVLDPQGKAFDGAKVILQIETEDRDRQHTAHLVASRFGIVHDDWTIPATADLGAYEIKLTTEDDENYALARHVVRVSRYDLPEFSVTAKPDRGAYLPQENTNVTITGTYLFGKPVPNGRVKITRSDQPRWNPKTRKFESNTEVAAEGEAGKNGIFVAELNLTADQAELAKSDYDRFKDVSFAAYYTDPSSGRTEQRRFDVRITREAIHVYVLPTSQGGPLPIPVYVSTDYADGSAASTDVVILYHSQVVTTHTNRYGVGRAFLASEGSDIDGGKLTVRATDKSGRTGSWVQEYWHPGPEAFRMDSVRTIYRAGESVELQISAPPDDLTDQFVVVNAIAGEQSVASRLARLVNGKAQVTFPYQPEFRRTVIFGAWNAASPRSVDQFNVLASKAVIFPDTSDLKLTATTDRRVYKPGEKATLHMQVTSSNGHPVEAALGLAIVDQAVLERARTDTEFGDRPWFACAFCRDYDNSDIGGISLHDLYTLTPSSSISPDLDLVGEALVAHQGAFISTESGESVQDRPRFKTMTTQVEQIRSTLEHHYAATLELPKSLWDLTRILGSKWTELRDPWGMPYRASFSIERDDDVVLITSSGPDKRAGTPDDFLAGSFRQSYFAPLQTLIRQILTTAEDYPANSVEFQKLLRGNGLLIESLRDPWGTPYRARVQTQGINRLITIRSAGPDRKFETTDDFVAATFTGPYFQREKALIANALQAAPSQPQNLGEFQTALKTAGIDLANFSDAWGRPYRLTSAISSRYTDRINSTTVQVFGGLARQRTDIVPVTQRLITFALRSAGPDGEEGTYDDFDIARFVTILEERSYAPTGGKPQSPNLLHGTGAITGTVTDPTGAVVANASVVLIDSANMSYEAVSGVDGVYEFTSVPPGTYGLKASSPGFNQYYVTQVPVTADHTTKLDITLNIGAVSQSVTVEASAAVLQTEAAEISARPISTPRVREYFPETLLWIPEAVTDQHGRVRTQVPLADSVTTWKIAAIASTVDGRIAEADGDFRTFQPFFLDFDPPHVLTEGDQIDLPVTVRNYQHREQKVSVNLQTNRWSKVLGPGAKHTTVAADSVATVSYTVQAKTATDAARERIIGTASHGRDAIEKTIRVHPDGQKVTQTVGDLIAGRTQFSIDIPQTAIATATRAELRIYPNIASMLLESASGILDSPHGCAEQTISAGYANLIALRYSRAVGINDPRIEKTALANIREARDGLAAFQTANGGISYWPNEQSDIGVTAYALSFLVDASNFIAVDKDDLGSLVASLRKNQRPDGTWQPQNSDARLGDRQATLLTALVARALAAAAKHGVSVPSSVLAGVYHHLGQFTDQYDEPYALAQFILAALDSGDDAILGDAANRLAGLAHEERGALYWDLHTNSPFYGWGRAGRLETTGLVVSALSRWHSKHPESRNMDLAIRRGLVFLLRERDREGTWFSTQATIRAMNAMADASEVLGKLGGSGGQLEIHSNGRLVKTLNLPTDPRALDPIILDMSPFLTAGENRLEFDPDGAQSALLRLSSTYWLPWSKTHPRHSDELRLAVAFDHTDGRANTPVHCSVKAERVGFRGYGMMIAEIGLPPGAEVDRASLESILADESLAVDRYEVLPDRILFYLWPKAGGASFSFVVRARLPMVAKSAASTLYDYYNPDARSEVAPSLWTVK